ncbi:molybdate ABC transporter substrate-binding protein [bacterium]|nr:molybdate ABC transporter substrate-binding protein [bacterium]
MPPLTRRAALMALAVATGLAAPVAAQAAEITVFAAASLKTALDAVAADWQKETGTTVTISYESSGKLAKQIQQGAPADLFISASTQWMDALAKGNLIKPDSRRDLLGNSLVLVAANKAATPVKIAKGFDLAGLVGTGKLAMGLVDSVPAGQYGKEALTNLGIWDAVAPKVAQADNVRAALKLVDLGEAPYGIVYASDAVSDPGVAVVGTFPDDSHAPIIYPAAVTVRSTAPEAQAFLDDLSTAKAAAIFAAQGFVVLQRP